MGKFKVGDRIELVEDYGGYDAGTKATVTSLWSEGVNADTDDGGDFGCYYHRVKLVPAFKVGDRVRMIKEVDGYKSDKTATVIHYDGTTYRPFAIECAEPFFQGHNADGIGKNGHCWWVSPDDIEHAPLTIEAGKFYMTRDGRRVGPALYRGGYFNIDGWDYSAAGKCGFYGRDNDEPERRHRDLIAEAPAPAYTSNAAAEVDNQADDYGGGKKAPKFKVGDRVKVVERDYDCYRMTGVVRFIDGDNNLVEFKGWGGGHNGTLSGLAFVGDNCYWIRDDGLVLAEADTNLSVTITADTSELDAEIDRVKKRLKKLAKRARKLGISLDYSDLREAA